MYSPIYSLYFLFLIQLVIRNENKLTNPSPALSLLKQAAYWMMYPTNISNTTDNGWITLRDFCHQVSGSSKAGCQPTYTKILLHQIKYHTHIPVLLCKYLFSLCGVHENFNVILKSLALTVMCFSLFLNLHYVRVSALSTYRK